MPNFEGEHATSYDNRIARLVPGYDLLHGITATQLRVKLPEKATILIVGAGTGKEVLALAELNREWHFIVQDISSDMLQIAEQNFAASGLVSADRITIHCGDLDDLEEKEDTLGVDAVLCLLVLHFLRDDNGEKEHLLKQAARKTKPNAPLFLVDLMAPETDFERESQVQFCRSSLGLPEAGETRMRKNLENEFYPITFTRLEKLLNECGFSSAHPYFKALGFTGIVSFKK